MDEKKRHDFNFNLEDSKEVKPDEHDSIEDKVDSMLELRKGSSSSSEEQARRYEEVLNDPPETDYGETKLYKAEDENGNITCALVDPVNGETTAKDEKGNEVKVSLLDPLLILDLHALFEGQLAEASMDVIPNLMDEKVQIEMNEKKEYKPEKAKRDLSDWYWVLYAVMFIPLIVIGLLFLGGIW